MNIDRFVESLSLQEARLREARSQSVDDIQWYPYDILGNVFHLAAMLSGENRDLGQLAKGLPVADIGAADGDLAFALEGAAGWQVDVVDTAATNMNGRSRSTTSTWTASSHYRTITMG
jgi:tRNA (mo5U34)-methyltransferase